MALPAAETQKPTQLAFALGQLTAELQQNTAETQRNRASLEALPDKVAEMFAPRFAIVDGKLGSHDSRLVALETSHNMLKGGAVVIFIAVSYLLGKPFIKL